MPQKTSKKSNRGGARPGSGRPRATSEPRRCVLSIALTEMELAEMSLRGGSRWAREVLLSAIASQPRGGKTLREVFD